VSKRRLLTHDTTDGEVSGYVYIKKVLYC